MVYIDMKLVFVLILAFCASHTVFCKTTTRLNKRQLGLFDPFGVFKAAQKKIQESINHVGEAMKKRMEGMQNAVKEVKQDVQDGIKEMVEGVEEHVQKVQDGVHKKLGSMKDNFQQAVKSVGEDMAEGVGEFLDDMATAKPIKVEILPNHIKKVEYLTNNEVSSNTESSRGGRDILGDILGRIGLSKKSLSTIALNVLIFIIEMITSSVMDNVAPNEINDMRAHETPLQYFLRNGNSERALTIMKQMQDPMLPQRFMNLFNDQDTKQVCMKLLICKTSPLIWGLQHSIHSVGEVLQGKLNFNKVFRGNMPTKKELISYGEKCNKHFPKCKADIIKHLRH